MARIAGVNIPTQKKIAVGLTSISGIGHYNAKCIIEKAGIHESRRVADLTDAEILKIREIIDKDYTVEGDKRREVSMNIKTELRVLTN